MDRRPLRKPQMGEKVLPPLTAPLRTGREMAKAIALELRAMTLETRTLIRRLADAPEAAVELHAALDALPDDAQRRLAALLARWAQRFESLAQHWSRRMAADIVNQSTGQLNIALKDLAERTAIHTTMSLPRMRAVVEAATLNCATLITRIPEKYLGEVQTRVMSAITTGSGLDKLVPYLTKRYQGDVRHAKLTALDQVRKASENVNAARLQALGSEEYVWMHTGGERYPRKLHQRYNGRVFRYDDPPVIDERTGERGKPGDAINCRCRQRAIINFTRMVA